MWLLYSAVVLLSLQNLVIAECPGVVTRDVWDALSPLHTKYVTRPVNIVIIMHTVSTQCTTDEACEIRMQSLQNYHMEDVGNWDIGSSFYVGSNKKIYEGVGWLRSGSHTYGYNDKSIGINFIGNYNKDVPTDDQLNAVRDLLKCGVEQGHLTQDFHVVGQRQLMATEGPGRKLYAAIRKWPEWLEDTSSIKSTTT
uniref:Peptidoglycan-recognition protein n=1 Tax=Calpodes ethlius TaxID=73634 RepID=O97369_CALET|nr:cuticular molt protein precursor [Calpodes ethlius]